MRKLNCILYLALVVNLLLASCKKDEIPSYKGVPSINFVGTTFNYSFLGNAQNEYVAEIDVNIMGDAADHDRHFNAVAVIDSVTTAKPNQYQIIGGLVKAGAYKGKLSVKVFNSTELNTAKVDLKLKLSDSEDFKAGNIETNQFVVGWTNQIIVPAWTYYRYFFTTAGSENAYRIIVQTTGLKTLTVAEYRALGQVAAETLGTAFGDYVKQWNKDHPNDRLKHDSGTLKGQDIVPLYYTHSKFD